VACCAYRLPWLVPEERWIVDWFGTLVSDPLGSGEIVISGSSAYMDPVHGSASKKPGKWGNSRFPRHHLSIPARGIRVDFL